MIFEELGQLLQTKKGLYTFWCFLLLPPLFAFTILFFQFRELSDTKFAFLSSLKKGHLALEKKGRQEAFLASYEKGDPFFISRQLESLSFLNEEQEALKYLSTHPAILEKEEIQRRLFFLENSNRLEFVEEDVKAIASMKESVEKQLRAVQMSEEDLKKVLSLIENRSIEGFMPSPHSPQILLQKIKIEKKQTPLSTEFLEVEMDLIKREFCTS